MLIEDNPSDALDRSIDEMQAGAAKAPRQHVKDPRIPQRLVTMSRAGFLKKFEDNFKKDPAKWARDRDSALNMASWIGALAVFHAEAHQKTEIDEKALQYATEQVATQCVLHVAEQKAVRPDSVEAKDEVWCS